MTNVEEIKNSLIHTYNNYANDRNSRTEIEAWKVTERAVFEVVMHSNQCKTLLEIGAGPGKDSLFYQESGYQVICTDLSPEMVRLCQERGLDARVMDYYKLDFSDCAFDAIYAMNCLLHVPKNQLGSVLHEIRRVMKPQALFYLGVYGGKDSEGIWEQDIYEPKRFFSLFSDEQLREVVEAYFAIETFNVVKLSAEGLHHQSLVLRRVQL